jgi:hypothetical protein
MRHPPMRPLQWSHHQKFVVIDDKQYVMLLVFVVVRDNLLNVHSLVRLLAELTSVRVVMTGTNIFVLILKDDIGGVLYVSILFL